MPKLLVRREGLTLVPATATANAALEKLPADETLIAEVDTFASEAQKNLYWAILGKVAPHVKGIETKEKLHQALKLHLGRYDLLEFHGKVVPVLKSITDWSRRDFNAFFNEAVDTICRDLLPKVGDPDLTAEVNEMLVPQEQRR